MYKNVYHKNYKARKAISINEIKNLSLKNIINELDFLKKKVIIHWSTWIRPNIPDPRNAKEHYQLFMVKKNKLSVKQSEVITYQPKAFQNPKLFI